MLSAQRIGRAGLGRLESFAEQTLKVARLAERDQPVGAENLRDQAIFVNYAPGAIAPLDPELIQIRDAVRQLP